MAAQYLIKKNAAAGTIFYVGLTPQTQDGTYKASPTLAAGDVKLSGDGGAFNNLGTLPTVAPAAGKAVKVVLSQAETNYDNIVIVFSDAAGAEWNDLLLSFETVDAQLADIYSRIGAPTGASIAADLVTLQADTDNIQTRLPTALVSGRMDSSVGAMAADVITAAATAADFGTEIAAAVWDRLSSALTTVGSIGKRLVDDITGDIYARIGAPVGASISADIAGVQADTDNIQTRIPAALVSGRMDSSVGAMAADVITAAATAADFGTEIAAAVWDRLSTALTTVGSIGKRLVDDITGDIYARIGAPAGASIAADIAGVQSDTDNIQTRIPAALVGGRMDSSVGVMAANVLTAAATAADFGTEIAAAVWDALVTGITTAGSIGKRLVDDITGDIYARIGAPVGASISADIAGVQSDTDNIQTRIPAALVGGRMDSSVGAMAANVLTAAATAADFGTEIAAAVWDALVTGITTAGSIGKRLVDDITGDIYARIGAPVGASISADIAGVQADTDNIQTRIPAALVGGRMDSSVGAMAANVLTAAATAADFGTEIAAAVWDYLTSAATTVGSLGKLLVDNVNATISSRLATVGYTAPDNASVTAIKSKTDNLPSDPADASDIAAAFSSVNSTLGTIASYIDTEVQSIKDKTDNLPASPAAVSDIPTVAQIVAGVFGQTIETGMTFLGSIRGMASALFGKVSGAGTATESFRNAVADDAGRLVVTVDADGNRTNVASTL